MSFWDDFGVILGMIFVIWLPDGADVAFSKKVFKKHMFSQ